MHSTTDRRMARGSVSYVGAMVRRLASPRLTLAGFAGLGAAVAAEYLEPGVPGWTIALPLGLLALNLGAALAVNPVLRRGGLGVFHLALLGCMLLLGVGRLTHFDGRIELVEGQDFDPAAVESVARGPWHPDGLRELQFTQGPFSVRYAPRLRREDTASMVGVPDRGQLVWQRVGDDEPLKLGGYRFYTTHNKGYAPVLTWTPPGAAPISGAIHLPSYPLFDWKQEQAWTPPDGPPLRFWLHHATAPDEKSAWTLESGKSDGARLVVDIAGRRVELRPGEAVEVGVASLRYDRLAGWMGYRIFYDPTLLPLLVLSVVGVLGMAFHLFTQPAPAQRRHRVGGAVSGRQRSQSTP